MKNEIIIKEGEAEAIFFYTTALAYILYQTTGWIWMKIATAIMSGIFLVITFLVLGLFFLNKK